MKSSFTKVLLAATVLSALTYSPAGVFAEPPAPAKSEKPKAPVITDVSPTIVPDGVADAEGKTAYLRNLDGGIDAIEIATGKTKWTTKAAAKPIMAIENRLFVQLPFFAEQEENASPNALKVAVWDSASGKQLLLSEVLIFPDWVEVAAEDGAIYGKNFVSATSLQDNKLFFKWQSSTHYAGGAAPPREIEEAARNNASGIMRVDLKTGRVDFGFLPRVNDKVESIELPWNVFFINGVAAFINQNDAATDPERKWSLVETINGKKIGKIALGDNPESVKIVGSNIFWVTSIQPEGGRMKPQTIERELNVAEIATGKILWKRALKPTQILPLPM